MPIYDVIIVGGGPAGATAGITLSGEGIRVLLIDKATFPRNKICGGGISIRAITRFPFLSKCLDTIPVNYISQVYLQSPDHSELLEERDDPIYFMAKRNHFDNMLLDMCKEGGVEVMENTRLRNIDRQKENFLSFLTSTGQTLKARIAIGADGVNSTTARNLGLSPVWSKSQKAIVMTGEATYGDQEITKKNTMYIFYGFGDSIGYGYVFPKSQSIDIGMGYLLSFYKEGREGLRDAYDGFVHFLKTNGFLASDASIQKPRAAVLPVAGPLKKTYADRVILCGDAGGFVNAFTAEGIYYAMVSGDIAAKVALKAIEEKSYDELFLSQYQDQCDAEIGEELHQSVKIQSRLFKNTKVINHIVREARKKRYMRRLLTDYSLGRLSPKSINKTLLLRFIPFLVKYKLIRIFQTLKLFR